MTQENAVPQGFVPVADSVDESVKYPVVDPVLFQGEGRTIVYHGSKMVPGYNDRPTQLHIIAPAERPGAKHVLWGQAMLNRKLENAGMGEVLFLRYLGKEPHPSLEGGTQHVWEVGRSSSAPNVTAGAKPSRVTSW